MSKVFSVMLAVVFSFGLFVLMTYLIEPNDNRGPVESTPYPSVVTLKDLEVIRKPPPKTPKKPELIKPIKSPSVVSQPQPAVKTVPQLKTVSLIDGTVFGDIEMLPRGGVSDYDGDNIRSPEIHVSPQYPHREASKGIEGYVKLRFDIDVNGSPINVKVIEAKPRGSFERSARRALKKWRYTPEKKDGENIPVFNQQVTLEYQLEEA